MKLRAITYNIHKGIGGVDRRYRPQRIIRVLEHYDPDVVLLQEVDEDAKRSGGHRQVDLLGDALGFRHRTFFHNVTLRRGGRYGNAILSRWPITETDNIDLTIPLKKRRSVLHARIRVRLRGHTRTLHVWNMHLGLSGLERRAQLRRFLDSDPFTGLHERTPMLVGGDLNDVYGSLARKVLRPAGLRGTRRMPQTFPAVAPVRPLDGVYVRGDLVIRNLVASRLKLARKASDHLPLVADLEIGAP